MQVPESKMKCLFLTEASPDAVQTCDTMDYLTDSREEDDSTTTARLNDRKRPSDSSIANDAKRCNYNKNSQTSSVSQSNIDAQDEGPKSTKSSEAEANNAVASTSQSNIEAQESTKNIESTDIDQESK